jgi:endonuclease/exonuclease/phosphatase family metal-dependent hydrolase
VRADRVVFLALLAHLDGDLRTPTVLLGDMNEWFPLGTPLRRVHARLGWSQGRRSVPSRLPVLALDRVWAQLQTALRDVRVHRSLLARVASDHLPVRATLDLGGPPGRDPEHPFVARGRN